MAFGVALAPWIVRLFRSEHYDEMALLTQIMFPMLALVAFAAFLQGILNSIGVFAPSAMGPILFNICWIAVPYLIGNVLGNPARAMALGVTDRRGRPGPMPASRRTQGGLSIRLHRPR